MHHHPSSRTPSPESTSRNPSAGKPSGGDFPPVITDHAWTHHDVDDAALCLIAVVGLLVALLLLGGVM